MIDTAAIRPHVGLGISCVWLDYLRGPGGQNHLSCRLTGQIFGPGHRQDAVCLPLCAYPPQHNRPRCRHMDMSNVVRTQGDPPLPKIACLAHHKHDAPGMCASCRDYEPLPSPSDADGD